MKRQSLSLFAATRKSDQDGTYLEPQAAQCNAKYPHNPKAGIRPVFLSNSSELTTLDRVASSSESAVAAHRPIWQLLTESGATVRSVTPTNTE